MSMGEEAYIRIQTCMLSVRVHCRGCRRNVEKRLRKIEGVYIVNVAPGNGKVRVKVTMAAGMSPEVLMKKLNRKRKVIADLITPQPANGGTLGSVMLGVNDGGGCGPVLGAVPTPLPPAPSVATSPAPTKKSEPAAAAAADVGEDEDEDCEDEEEDEDEDEDADEDEEEDEEDEDAEKVVAAPANCTTTKSSGASQATPIAASPKVNALTTNVNQVNPVNPNRGPMTNVSDTTEAMRAIAAARSAQISGAGGGAPNTGFHMDQRMGHLPPRPNLGPFNQTSPYPFGQQLQHNMSYMQHQPQQCPPYQYGAQAAAHKAGDDQFLHAFSDENTGSCAVM